MEGSIAYTFHTIWDNDGCQAAATIEGIHAYAGHTIGYSNGGQSTAKIEDIVA